MQKPVRCEIIPLERQQFSFRVDGVEKTCWHAAPDTPRPFFFPLNGPSGESLTRMGHPGAPNHDHHRSVWFAHHDLLGTSYWADNTLGRIRQTEWKVITDGDTAATLAVELGWFDGHDPAPLVRQEVITTLTPLENDEYTLDLQSTFYPTAAEIEFAQTNFGFLAVRVAKSISGHFGGGQLTGANGAVGEPELFGQANPWMDYTGPVSITRNGERHSRIEGITYFDHPANPSFPAKWHVREDGWMGASACRDAGLITTRMDPLRLRYLIHVHAGAVDGEGAGALAAEWAKRPMQTVEKGKGHQQYQLANVD